MLIITICVGSSCSIRGSDDLAQALQQCIVAERLEDRVEMVGAFCMEACSKGVSIKVGERSFSGLRPEEARDFFYKEIMPYV